MTDVIVVGGGPVGLLLSLRLLTLGIRPLVLERHPAGRRGTRSIGIHPPALRLLDELGLAPAFVSRGVPVTEGRLFLDGKPLARLDLMHALDPDGPVVSVPQSITESILQNALEARAPGALVRRAEVVGVRCGPERVKALVLRDGSPESYEARFLVACDGRHSRIRELLGVRFRGWTYAGGYAMCDASDTTDLGRAAGVFLHRVGLVESFPLPEGRRRWVIRRAPRSTPPCSAPIAVAREIAGGVRRRTPYRLPPEQLSVSTFVAERRLAAQLAAGRVAFAGDAAHVVSPIGGQGMNLGWLGAWSLAAALLRALEGQPGVLQADAAVRVQLARRVAHRTELNMWLGRPGAGVSRGLLLRCLLNEPLSRPVARLFTMRSVIGGPWCSPGDRLGR